MAILPTSPSYWKTAVRDTIVGLILTAVATWALTSFVVPEIRSQFIGLNGTRWDPSPTNTDYFDLRCEYRFRIDDNISFVELNLKKPYVVKPTVVTTELLISEYGANVMLLRRGSKKTMNMGGASGPIGDYAVSTLEQRCLP